MAWLRLIYHQIAYWLVGTSPESHHANLAYVWYDLNRHRNCIDQCQKYLSYQSSDQMLVMMAYCYAALEDWAQTADAYRSLSNIWAIPQAALGLAEAELRCGNLDEARRIIATVEANDPSPPDEVTRALEYLHGELSEAENRE